MRKPILIAAATLLLFGLGAWVIAMSRMVSWVGHQSLPIVVSVHEAETGEPIPNATVLAFDGPRTPVDGMQLGALQLDPSSSEGSRFTTDERGQCEFAFPFPASGTDGVLSRNGGIVVSGVWLRVTVPDGRRVLVPIDQHSVRPRELNDRSPILVTVVIDRPVSP